MPSYDIAGPRMDVRLAGARCRGVTIEGCTMAGRRIDGIETLSAHYRKSVS